MKTKDRILSLRITALIAEGVEPIEALRQVVGAKLVDQMIDSLYSELRRKAVA